MTGFDKQLHDMEIKLHYTVRDRLKANKSTNEPDELNVGDIIAANVPFWDKWVRAQIKEIAENGLFYVWTIDYGVPLVLKSSQIVKIQPIYAKMNTKYPRIFVGGLIDCIPAESSYDLINDAKIVTDLPNWSTKAIEMVKTAISSTNCLKFEKTKEISLMNRMHRFGHLKCQRSDGSWIDLNTSLTNALFAKSYTNGFSTQIDRLDSIRQIEWKNDAGIPFSVSFNILPEQFKEKCLLNVDNNRNDLDNQSNEQTPETNVVEINNDNTDKTLKSNDQKTPSDRRVNQSHQNYSRSRSLVNHNFNTDAQINLCSENQRYMGNRQNFSRNYDQNSYEAQFPLGWHTNGKLNNRKYRKEVEFFEASFRKPTKPNEKIETLALSSEETTEQKSEQTDEEKIENQSNKANVTADTVPNKTE